MKLTEKSKRLGIFIFYDRDGIIDDYVLYMLDSLNVAVDNIIFVSNSYLSKKELSKLSKYNLEVNLRENKGLDAGAFKFVYDKYGKEYISSYDEVILLNDTFFGPFKPFKDIINSMNNKNVDFWGLTANYNSKDGTGHAIDKFIHSHVQTFFVAYRKSVLESKFFNNYWKKYNIKKNNNFENVVNNHESYFTYLLEQQGFKWDTYVDLRHFKKELIKYNYNIYGYSAYMLLKYFDCPFIKRKNFVFNKCDALYMNDGMDTKRALDYIKNNTNYDVNMIFKNILRLYKPFDIYQSLNMNYVVKETNKKYDRKLIIANVCDKDSYNISKDYFDNIKECEIKLYTENKSLSKNLNIEFVNNLYNYILDSKDTLVKKYDYICLLNLNDTVNCFQEVVDSKLIRLLDNTIKSDRYINGVIDVFNNSFTSLLFTPYTIHNKNIMNLTGRNKFMILSNVEERNNIRFNINNLVKSFDGLWIKSNVLNNVKRLDASYYEFISLFELFDDIDFFGKIYSCDTIEGDIISLETVYNYVSYSNKTEISFPNKMILNNTTNPFRNLFRTIIPLNFRKRLKKILRIK